MNKYIYEGSVMEFGNVIANRWRGETFAPSEKKARANLAHKYKKKHNRTAGAKIVLPGKIALVD